MAENQQLINLGSIQAPYLEQELSIPAGGIKKFDYVHNCFSLLDSDGVLNLTFGGAAVESRFTAGMYYELTDAVPYVILYNRTNSTLNIHFAMGIGVIKDNRLTVSGNVNVMPASGGVFPVKNQGFTNYTAGSTTGNSTLNYGDNSQIDVLCTSGTITVDNAAGVSSLVLNAGQTWSACLATAGTLTFTGTGSYNFSVGDWN